MHACGHDIHMSTFIGTARALGKLKDKWHGTIIFIGQPAEETVGGRACNAERRALHALAKARLRAGLARRRRDRDRQDRHHRRLLLRERRFS